MLGDVICISRAWKGGFSEVKLGEGIGKEKPYACAVYEEEFGSGKEAGALNAADFVFISGIPNGGERKGFTCSKALRGRWYCLRTALDSSSHHQMLLINL